MEVFLKISLRDYGIKEFEDTGMIIIVKKGLSGKPDYSIDGEGFVVEFKNGEIYIIDIYDPEVARNFREKLSLSYV
ncbi:hypothetical protein [Pampinifervens florentissimum]|uniref:hypothetical protein n=1 Tax=Pampinifervens florentissimum TaxID=1632019 RepID=UPI0013B49ABE|nr:hypothetical protein [Hydrogenobacter sp. T-8]QID33762.1 hypothetical protein G3M65_08255 [Hydrogenobacter sp. T-8]